MTKPARLIALLPVMLAALAFQADGQTLTITNGIQIYGSLTNTTVTMSNRCELRVLATTNPIPGCVVNLTSPDSWFFLPNIRPSVVSAYYLSQLRVNGATAVAGSNCRLDQYAMGSVVVPQAPGFTPLTVFSAQNFLGPSTNFGIYTYYNTSAALGAMYRNISSFHLKRGYLATFAQNADGTGVSQVYVAQDGDLDVGVMATNLDHQCSFVRVVPWRWTGKKGWVGGLSSATALIDPLWNYDYDNVTSSSLDTEYVPMRDTAYWDDYANINSKQKSTQAIAFNEPDQANQANMTVAAAIAQWPSLMQSGLRVGAPAVSSSGVAGQGPSWLYSFMSSATNLGYRVDFIPVHIYKCSWTATQYYNYLLGIYQATGRPLWVTEFNDTDFSSGCNQTQSSTASAISSYISMMESMPFVERYSVYEYFDPSTSLNLVTTNSPPTLTPAGVVYHNQQSGLAYLQTVPPGASRSIAQYQFETNVLDSSGYGNNGFANGLATYTAGHTGQAVSLDGTNNFIQLPTTIANSAAFTFAAWVYWNGGPQWQRIFDFGDDTSHYLFLTPNSGSGTLRFAINNGGGEQTIETSVMPSGVWRHIAVTLSGSSAKLYTNGVLATSSSSFSILPSNFNPNLNYLGKSQFAADPLFRGNLDEVQIADTALTAAQISALMTNPPPQFATNFMAGGSATEAVAFSTNLNGTASDPNPGDTLTYSKAGGPAWLSVSAGGILSGTPGSGDGGTNYVTVRVTDASGASAFMVVAVSVTVISVNGVWNKDASGIWSDTNNWSGGAVASAAGFTADFSTINITANRAVTLDSPRSIGALKFGDASGVQNWNLLSSGGSTLTLDSGSTALPSILVTNTATISIPLAGVNGFTKGGPGTLVLSNANTLSGNARLLSGTLKIATTNALQAATLSLDDGDTGALAFGTITSANLGGVIGTRNLVLQNSGSAAVALNLVGNGNYSYAGIFSGFGSLVKSGTGTFTLSSSNTYSGGTIISGGTLKLSRDPVVKFAFENPAGSTSGATVTNAGTAGAPMNGTILGTGASVVSGGISGNALNINGVGGTARTNIVLVNNRGITTDASATWTLGYWIKTTTAGAVIMYQGDGGWSSSGQTAYLLNANSGSVAGTTAGAVRWAGGFLTGTTALNNGVWHFVTLVDKAGTETIYVDGRADTVSSTMGLALSSLANQMWIGGAPDTDAGAIKINGMIDEVCLYNRALVLSEIQSLTNSVPKSVPGNFGGQLPAVGVLSIAQGATFDLGGNSQTIAALADAGGGGMVTNSGLAPATLTFNLNGIATNTFSGVIIDAAATNFISIVKNGTATEALAGASTYRGTTTVNSGALLVNGSLGTNMVTVNGGRLGGIGTIAGPVNISLGGNLAPGISAVGTLTINNALTLNGTCSIKLDKSAQTNDVIVGVSSLTCGGTLNVINLNDPLAAGDSFQIFSATNYSGNFVTLNLPALGTGLAWDTTNLNVNGTLSVVVTAVPQFTAILPATDGNFIFSGTGAAGLTYELEAATNLMSPIFWLFVTNTVVDQTGFFQMSDPSATNYPQRFYRVMSSQ